MAEQVLPYALTTLQRVKDRLFDPNKTILISGNLTSGSAAITSVSSVTNLYVGQVVTSPTGYVPFGATIISIVGATVTLSANATGTATNANVYVVNQPTSWDSVLTRLINGVTDFLEQECGGRRFLSTAYTNEVYTALSHRQKFLVLRNAPVTALTSFQWRSGTPSNPVYTSFIQDQYELMDPDNNGVSKSGIIRVYGIIPAIYINMLRVSYTAGYLINWANAGDNVTHTLPSDLTSTAENLVVRHFKRLQNAGKASESLAGASTSWNKLLDTVDTDVIGRYMRSPIYS